MNKKNLALLISKHPLLRKLTENKTIPKSIVARLIVEELLKENIDSLNKAIEGSNDEELKQLFQKFLETLESGDSSKINFNGVVSTILFMVNRKKLKQAKEKLANSIKAMAGQQQPQQDGDSQLKPILDKFANFIKYSGVLKENIGTLIKALQPKDKKVFGDSFSRQFKRNEIQVLKQYFEKKENILLFVKEYFGNEPDKDQILQNIEKISSGRGLEAPQTQAEPSGEPSKEPGTDGETSGEPTEEPTAEPTSEPEETEGANKKDPEPSEIPEEEKTRYVEASTNFQNEFYNQKYRRQQAELIEDVIEAIEKIYDNPNKVAAFGRPPEEQQTVTEQQDTVEASKDELRNLRIDFRSLLSRVNKASKALNKFEELKKEGSVVTDVYKKKFIDLLKQIQASIKRIHRDLQIIIGKRGEIKEAVDTSDVMKQWKEVQEKYNKAIASSAALRELIDGTQTSEDPDKIVEDTYTALSDLATHFPSVNPFAGSEAKTTGDMKKYKNSFENAVGKVKSDLQNVLSLIKNAQSGEDTLQLAMEGLVSFSGAIQNIFGVESQFADVKIDKETPAAEGQAEEIRVVEPSANRGILNLPKPENLKPEQEEALKNIEYSEADTEIVNRVAQVFVGVDSVPTEPDQIKKAAEEVIELKREMEEMTEISDAFGFTPEEMRAMVGLKRFLETEPIKISESQEPPAILEVPSEISKKIAEYGKMLEEANEGSYEVFKNALAKAAALSESEKNKFYKFLGIPTKLEQTLNSEIKNLKEKFSKEEKEYIAAYAAAIFEFLKKKDKIGNKNEPSYKSDSLRRIIYRSSLQEKEVTATDKLGLTSEDHKQIQELMPEEQKEWFKQYKGKTKISNQLQYHKEEFGKLLLLMLDKKIFEYFKKNQTPDNSNGLSNTESIGAPSRMESFRSLHEQLANKLKPLIREMLTKGK